LTAADIATSREMDIARKLVGEPLLRVSRVGGGRNSRVYRVDTRDRVFALKQYPSLEDDPRDRLGVEANALKWMANHRLDMVPRLVAMDNVTNCALLTWAEGSQVRDVGPSDIDQAVGFLGALKRLRGTVSFPVSHLASEACLSGIELERQIRTRVADLDGLEDEPALRAFLTGEFAGTLEDCLSTARKVLSSAGLSFQRELTQEQRSLVPSDFGFHNALRDEKGRLTFIDFEYFGWDDPAKLTADMLLHPGTPVATELRSRFQVAAEKLYGDDPEFATRLCAFHPLFGMRWVLILLNEFHPERWRRRILAGASDGWAAAKDRQLRAARAMLMNSKAWGRYLE
jgi:Ser/Thr protein kinase RdoA (MazF antagonist)